MQEGKTLGDIAPRDLRRFFDRKIWAVSWIARVVTVKAIADWMELSPFRLVPRS